MNNTKESESKKKLVDLLGPNYENEIGGRLAKLNLKDEDAQKIKSKVITSYNSGGSHLGILYTYLYAVNSIKKEDTNEINSSFYYDDRNERYAETLRKQKAKKQEIKKLKNLPEDNVQERSFENLANQNTLTDNTSNDKDVNDILVICDENSIDSTPFNAVKELLNELNIEFRVIEVKFLPEELSNPTLQMCKVDKNQWEILKNSINIDTVFVDKLINEYGLDPMNFIWSTSGEIQNYVYVNPTIVINKNEFIYGFNEIEIRKKLETQYNNSHISPLDSTQNKDIRIKKMNKAENVENIDGELRQREIRRLTSPLNYHNTIDGKPTDIEGNPVEGTDSFSGMKYIPEPKIGILTDDEILKYAGESEIASKIRLKRGIGSFSDKTKLYGDKLIVMWGGSLMPAFVLYLIIEYYISSSNAFILTFLFTLGILSFCTIYIYYLKNYTEVNTKKQVNVIEENNLKSKSINPTISNNILSLKVYEKQIQELESLYKIKEKFAIELIEKRFTPPQLTYDRFIGVIDSCNQIFYEQVESASNIIEVATEHTPRIDEEIKKKLSTLKSLIETIDELTNELAINLSNSSEEFYSDEVKYLLDDMKNLVDSIKEYD